MYYEVNVSRHGQHYFATAKRSITSLQACLGLVAHFELVFPVSAGYQVTATRYEESGVQVYPNASDKAVTGFVQATKASDAFAASDSERELGQRYLAATQHDPCE